MRRCSEPGRRLTAPPAARPAQLNRWAIRTRRFEKQTTCETADFAAPTIPGEELLSYGIGPRLRRFTFVLLHVRMELLLSAERLAARRTLVQASFTALPHLLHGLLPSLISARLGRHGRALPLRNNTQTQAGKERHRIEGLRGRQGGYISFASPRWGRRHALPST